MRARNVACENQATNEFKNGTENDEQSRKAGQKKHEGKKKKKKNTQDQQKKEQKNERPKRNEQSDHTGGFSTDLVCGEKIGAT